MKFELRDDKDKLIYQVHIDECTQHTYASFSIPIIADGMAVRSVAFSVEAHKLNNDPQMKLYGND